MFVAHRSIRSRACRRASYVGDLSHRRLLTPGKRCHLDFQGVRLMSRQLRQGSRVAAVLSVIKEPGRQINYGTDQDVSDENIRDAGTPLDIKWYAASYPRPRSVRSALQLCFAVQLKHLLRRRRVQHVEL